MKNTSIKIISLIMAVIVAVGCMMSSFASNLIGDANGDSKIDSADALVALQHTVGITVENFDATAADVIADGVINSSDALRILEICVGLVDDPNKPTDTEPTEPTEPERTPLDYDKAELVEYYNNALKQVYAEQSVTVHKKTDVSVDIDKLEPESLKSIASSLIESYAKPEEKTETFIGGVAADGTTVEKFAVPTALEADGVANATVEAIENGYKVTIAIVAEECTHKDSPKYNTQGSVPLVIPLDMLEDYGAKISSSKFSYPATVITAEIDAQGNITKLNHKMDLNVEGKGQYKVLFKNYDFEVVGHGNFDLTATFTVNKTEA